MFELLRHTLRNQLLPQQLLSGGTAFLIANEFYKFHSFGLELYVRSFASGARDLSLVRSEM